MHSYFIVIAILIPDNEIPIGRSSVVFNEDIRKTNLISLKIRKILLYGHLKDSKNYHVFLKKNFLIVIKILAFNVKSIPKRITNQHKSHH